MLVDWSTSLCHLPLSSLLEPPPSFFSPQSQWSDLPLQIPRIDAEETERGKEGVMWVMLRSNESRGILNLVLLE